MQTVLNSIMQELPSGEGSTPEWVHLLPAGTFSGADGRGPFELGDASAVITASMLPGRKLPIDVNHAIDHVGSTGGASPAVGWIVSLEARGDGIWGRVEWTPAGRKHLAEKDYGYLSPVFTHPKSGLKQINQLLRAALTNDPNLTLASLHHRKHEDQEMEKQMREALGLPETATSEEILKAAKDRVASLKEATEKMSRIAKAAGLKDDASEAEIVTALNTRKAAAANAATDAEKDAEIKGLEEQITALNTRLNTVSENASRKDAEAAIDRAIEDGKIVPALRDRFIARHMKDAADVDGEIKLMPSLNSGGLGRRRPTDESGASLSDDDAAIVEAMGLDPKTYAETSSALQKERG